MFDLTTLVQALGPHAPRFDAELLPECASTNALLLERAEAGAPSGTVLIAERQTAGRGRRGRPWLSAPGESLTFSLLWRFAPGTSLAGLPLAAGLALAEALLKLCAGQAAPHTTSPSSNAFPCGETQPQPSQARIRLKWPNDVLKDGKKLAGILVEVASATSVAAVIGIGLNLRLPTAMPAELRAQSAALEGDIDPHFLLASILVELLKTLETFGAQGFAALRPRWTALHAFENAPIRLLSDFSPPREGICRGVDVDGTLLFESGGCIERILSGEVSLRSVA